MAFGLADVGGVLSYPLVPEAGYDSWAEMSGMGPGHPLVGGTSGAPGYPELKQVAVGQPTATLGASSGAPASSHWSELFNFKGNPIGWVLIAAVLYLGLMHIHVRAAASGGAGFKAGK